MGRLAKIYIGFFFFIILFFSSAAVYAEDATSSTKSTYEAFWPLTAGRTIGDPLYFLKIFKEDLREIFIFGSPRKAEYAVFIGTKRVLEADKLLKEGNKDFTDKTLINAAEQFDKAQKNMDSAKKEKKPLDVIESSVKPRLENLVILLQTMQSGKASEILKKVESIRNTI